MKRTLALLSVCLFVVSIACAQTQSMGSMSHSLPVPKGSDNPQNISDATAYHLVLAHFANLLGDSNTTESHTGGLLRLTGLSHNDQEQFIAVVDIFRTQFAASISTHNRNVSIGLVEDFSAAQDTLVNSARTQLLQNLSPGGMATFDAFVQKEKRHMQTSAPNGGSLPMLDAIAPLTNCVFSPQYSGYATFANGGEVGIIWTGRASGVVTITAYRGSFLTGQTVLVDGSNNGGDVLLNGTHVLTSANNNTTVLIQYPRGHIPPYTVVPASILTFSQAGQDSQTAGDSGDVALYQGINAQLPMVVDATLTGYTTGIAACMQNAMHTPQTRIGNPNNQQIINGTPVTPPTYINMTSTRTYMVAPGQVEQMSVQENVTCTVVGEFNDFINVVQTEFAYTRAASTGGQSNCVSYPALIIGGIVVIHAFTECTISAVDWCTPTTTPPDVSIPGVRETTIRDGKPVVLPDFWDALTFAYRDGPGATWQTISALRPITYPYYSPQSFGICDRNP